MNFIPVKNDTKFSRLSDVALSVDLHQKVGQPTRELNMLNNIFSNTENEGRADVDDAFQINDFFL